MEPVDGRFGHWSCAGSGYEYGAGLRVRFYIYQNVSDETRCCCTLGLWRLWNAEKEGWDIGLVLGLNRVLV